MSGVELHPPVPAPSTPETAVLAPSVVRTHTTVAVVIVLPFE